MSMPMHMGQNSSIELEMLRPGPAGVHLQCSQEHSPRLCQARTGLTGKWPYYRTAMSHDGSIELEMERIGRAAVELQCPQSCNGWTDARTETIFYPHLLSFRTAGDKIFYQIKAKFIFKSSRLVHYLNSKIVDLSIIHCCFFTTFNILFLMRT